MKKLVSITIALVLLALPLAHAGETFDLSEMSFAELVALKEQLNLAIWESEEWQEVTVPQGAWEVGVDIPAGHWTISPVDGASLNIVWCSELDESGTNYARGSILDNDLIRSPTRRGYAEGSDRSQIDWDLTEGTYVIANGGDIVFTPYAGKPDLGFK